VEAEAVLVRMAAHEVVLEDVPEPVYQAGPIEEIQETILEENNGNA
jgi:hypothetical protein